MIINRVQAQCLVLSSGLWNGPDIWQMVNPETMDDGYRQVAQAMKHLSDTGRPVTHETLTAECARRSVTLGMDRWAMYPIAASEAASKYEDATARTRIEQALLRGSQMMETGASHWDVTDDFLDLIERLNRPAGESEPYGLDWDDVVGIQQEETDWVLPGLLSRSERCVITGQEGHGKSTLIYQMVLGAAYGVSPLDGETTFKPQRVLILDVENTQVQIAEQYRTMRAAYRSKARAPFDKPDVRLMSTKYMDLSRLVDRRRVIDAANDFQPDLMFMGSGYRLADGTQDHRVIAMSIQQTIDQIRADVGAAVILETHAGHGFQNDRNGWRPDGSSYWMRWPEFGLGLAPVKIRSGRMTQVVKWRGDRITGREWPDGFRSGGVLPWVPAEEAEIEFAKAQ